MNVVVKVGSLISQGVYSVATPFHPFGGAVDVIVVQQQDGTFQSTPWYVRFGKFQGVLKGAEKIVKIAVNGVEANFHMYLDNSGEAYFVREVDPGKESETDGILKDVGISGDAHGESYRLGHCVSDSGVAQFRDNYESLNQFERTESDGSRRYYDFQDKQSPAISEYGSARYDDLDIETFEESQGLDSEVVLVSVDGHILTAPVSASEQDTVNVRLSTPQFHLAPGDGTEFCDGNAEFTSPDNSWASNYISRVDSVEAKVESNNDCSMNNNDNALDLQMDSGSEKLSNGNERTDRGEEYVSERCLLHRGDAKFEEPGMNFEVQHSREELPHDTFEEDKTKNPGVVEAIKDDKLSLSSGPESSDFPVKKESQEQENVKITGECRLVVEHVESRRISVDSSTYSEGKDGQLNIIAAADSLVEYQGSRIVESHIANTIEEIQHDHASTKCEGSERITIDSECKDERLSTSTATGGTHHSAVEYEEGEIVESQAATSGDRIQQANARLRFDISLCADELHPGMGLCAAAQVFDAHRISAEEYNNSAISIVESENLVVRIGDQYLPWEKAVPIVLGKAVFDLDLPMEPNHLIPVWKEETVKPKDDDTVITPSSSGRRWRLWPIPFRWVKTIDHTSSNSSGEEVFVDSEPGLQNSQAELIPTAEISHKSPRKQFVRTNVPTSEQIASLNLNDGQNTITFSFPTRVLGSQQVDAHIYLWKWNAKIVISDVDGTITKSDVLGQFMPLVGKDWTQSGVAKLFSAIKENGYQLLFLSARAIVQAYLTRSFLLNLKQDGKALPSGPVVISPDGLLLALYREVIRRAPHEFKIACLEDIKKLFPPDCNPFYAGFGNRDTDELSYRKLGIPKGKIFIINPKGEIATGHRIGCKSYTSLHTLVNDMFPPTSLVEQEDYNSWNFWKMPLEEID